MTISNTQLQAINSISASNSWEELASGWNLHQELGVALFEASVEKGKEEGLNNEEIVKALIDAGCKLTPQALNNKLSYYDFKEELRFLKHVSDNLNEPENEAQFRGLGKTAEFTSTQEKLEEFNEIKKENNGVSPSFAKTQERNTTINKVKNVITPEHYAKKEEPQPKSNRVKLSVDEITEFRQWLKETKGIDAVKDKPEVNIMQLTSLRDEIIDELLNKMPEWKKSRKAMLKLIHPDNGGTSEAFLFFPYFDKLMKNIYQLYIYVKFLMDIDAYKKEWKSITQKEN